MSNRIIPDIGIGKNLKRLRLDAGLTQERAAAKLQLMGLSVSREILSQMERDRYNIKVSILLALKEIYKASFEDFSKTCRESLCGFRRAFYFGG